MHITIRTPNLHKTQNRVKKFYLPFFFFVQEYPYRVSLWHQTTFWRVVINEVLGSLSKHDVDGSKNVIWRCNFAFLLQSFFQLFNVIMLEKCVLSILELNRNQRLGHKKTKLNICQHILTSYTQLQNRSFHVEERARTSSKCQKLKNALAKRAKILFFIVKYANMWGFCCRRRRGCLSSLLCHSRRRKTKLMFSAKLVVVKT